MHNFTELTSQAASTKAGMVTKDKLSHRVNFLYSPGSPLVITAFNTSSSSIVVKWEQNQSPDHNIAGYRLAYKERNSNKELHNVLCPLANFTVKLTNLKAFTNYCIELNSFTNTSVSNRSQCRFVKTDEDSKCFNIWMFCSVKA